MSRSSVGGAPEGMALILVRACNPGPWRPAWWWGSGSGRILLIDLRAARFFGGPLRARAWKAAVTAAGQSRRADEGAEKKNDKRRRVHLPSMIQRLPRHYSAAAMASADAVDGLNLGFAAGAVAVDQDRERKGLAAGRGQVAGERVGFVERAGLGPQLAFERRVFEALGERAVDAGDGQRIAPGCAPGLARGVGEQLREGARSDAVVQAHARAVVEEEVAVVHARVDQELAHHARALGEAAVVAVELAEQAQQQFGVQVLAGFVDDRDVSATGTEMCVASTLRPSCGAADAWSGATGRELERLRALARQSRRFRRVSVARGGRCR